MRLGVTLPLFLSLQDTNQAKVAKENGAVFAGGAELIQPVSWIIQHIHYLFVFLFPSREISYISLDFFFFEVVLCSISFFFFLQKFIECCHA